MLPSFDFGIGDELLGILSSNFLRKSNLSIIDTCLKRTHVDEKFQLNIYQFNLIKGNCPPFRSFDESFTRIVINIDSSEKREILIALLKEDLDRIDKSLEEFEAILNKCGMSGKFNMLYHNCIVMM